MGRKQRPSVQKREREQKKAEKAARKRERRESDAASNAVPPEAETDPEPTDQPQNG